MRRFWQRFRRAGLYGAALVWRARLFRTTFVAFAGSAGKTTAREALAAILAGRAAVVQAELGGNELADLARLILRLRARHRFVLLEVPVDGPAWSTPMAWLARPDIAVVLGVARARWNRFGGFEAGAREKSVVRAAIRRGGVAVLNADDPAVAPMAALTSDREVLFGGSPEFDIWADGIRCRFPQPLEFCVHDEGRPVQFRVPLVGEHWTASLLAAVAAAGLRGIGLPEAAQALSAFRPVEGRMQPVRTPCGAVILRDDENGPAATLEEALETLALARATRKLAVVGEAAGDPVEQRQRAIRLGRAVAGVADVGIFTGRLAELAVKGAVAGGLPAENAYAFVSPRRASEFLRRELRRGDLVLLKGRASDHLGRIAFAQFGEIACWVENCGKPIACSACDELRRGPALRARPKLVTIRPR